MGNKEPNTALATEVKQILTDEIKDDCRECPIYGVDGAHGLHITFDAKYDRASEEDVLEAAHNLAKYVNGRCRLGTSALRGTGCFGSGGLHCNIDRL